MRPRHHIYTSETAGRPEKTQLQNVNVSYVVEQRAEQQMAINKTHILSISLVCISHL